MPAFSFTLEYGLHSLSVKSTSQGKCNLYINGIFFIGGGMGEVEIKSEKEKERRKENQEEISALVGPICSAR